MSPCILTPATAPAAQTYSIFDPEINVAIGDYLPRPLCPEDTISLSLANGDPVPSVISFDAETRSVRIVGNDLSEEGVYDVIVISTFEDQLDSSVQFTVTVIDSNEAEINVIENQSAPYFTSPIENQFVECGQLMKISMSEVKDKEDDYDSMKVQLANTTTFMDFNHYDHSFTIQAGATNASDVGFYKILITLADREKH